MNPKDFVPVLEKYVCLSFILTHGILELFDQQLSVYINILKTVLDSY